MLGASNQTLTPSQRYKKKDEYCQLVEDIAREKQQSISGKRNERKRNKRSLEKPEHQQQAIVSPILNPNELNSEEDILHDDWGLWDQVIGVSNIKVSDVHFFERCLIHCQEDEEQLQALLNQLTDYYTQLDIPTACIIPDQSRNNTKKIVNNAIDNLRLYVLAYKSGTTAKIPNCNNSHLNHADQRKREFIKQVCQFEQDMFNVQFSCCNMCRQKRLNFPIDKNGQCNRCKMVPRDGHRFSHKNGSLPTWTDNNGVVHYELPTVLKELSVAEKLLIQKVSPIVPVLHIKNGTLGSRGHCCSFFQNIDKICNIFPRMPSEVTMVKVIRKSTDKNGNIVNRAFNINRKKVLDALEFLKEHNILYRDIIIEKENFSWMKDKLECMLPSVITIESSETEAEDPDR